jgi:hypothetical protein
MTKFQQRLETFFAGLLYVTIGTFVAVQVGAQSNVKPSASKTPSCDSKTSPDALCSVAPAASKFKVCFSNRHPRCFELQQAKLIQSLNNMPVHDTTLDKTQTAELTKAVKTYRAWLESKKAPSSTIDCSHVILVDVGADHKSFCVAGLEKKEMQEKNKALIDTLETPPGAKSTH